ncbi:MAG: hypothetical protein ACRCYY_08005, partial [Trueperaceae bacterium]
MGKTRSLCQYMVYGLVALVLSACSDSATSLQATADGWIFTQSQNINDWWLEVAVTPVDGYEISKVAVVYNG